MPNQTALLEINGFVDICAGQQMEVFSEGKFQKKPMIIGSTPEDCLFFMYDVLTMDVSPVEYEALLNLLIPQQIVNITQVRFIISS